MPVTREQLSAAAGMVLLLASAHAHKSGQHMAMKSGLNKENMGGFTALVRTASIVRKKPRCVSVLDRQHRAPPVAPAAAGGQALPAVVWRHFYSDWCLAAAARLSALKQNEKK
ncbi:hypothetical protein [Hydrogenophaga sp.]|uniref:hypothetical protein n=1 Tax=Hydrogenophaga sp. TaxID=1904254 RepID=UPI0025B9E043|nr:hypothetical protein [Hydrogenophaga sp.]